MLATEALAIQRREVEAADAARRRETQAQLDATYWEDRREQKKGIYVHNTGRGAARTIQVLWSPGDGGPPRMREWSAIAAGGALAVIDSQDGLAPATKVPPLAPSGLVSMKICWTNEDGSPGFTDWKPVEHREDPPVGVQFIA